MLSKERRISKGLFEQILAEGRSFHTPLLSLKACPRKEPGKSAFSFVVSAKTAPRAVDRHFLKRRGRHALKKQLGRLKEGYYCVFFLKKGLLELPFPEFEAAILDGLKQARLVQ